MLGLKVTASDMNKKDFVLKHRSLLPAHSILIVIGLLLIFLLGACETATQTPSSELVVDQIQAFVAETLTTQATPSPTPTAGAISIPTISATPTPYSTLTTVTPTPISYSSSSSSYSTPHTCNSSEFVTDVTIPDGTVFSPGETFIKTWKFKNTGTCTWQEDYLIVFVDGNAMDGDATYLDTAVVVGKRGDASVFMVAPDEEGTYYGHWQLADADGDTFGETAYIEIVVDEDVTSTPTASATPTPTATQTPTYTPTATATSASTCVDTPTATPTPTYTPIPSGELTGESTEEPTEVPTEEPAEEPTVEPVETDTVFSIIGWLF
ncbi:hypothetical protein ANAEL_02233 [Anaerolineales bacterium]|nr:hypothetical protein ANAEL_02233 [Anaerolineales bacterium]